MHPISPTFLLVLLSVTRVGCEPVVLFESKGDVKLGLLVQDCAQDPTWNVVNAAVWVTERLNLLQTTAPFVLGLTAVKVCDEMDYYVAIFQLFQQDEKEFLLGIVTTRSLSAKLEKFRDVLGVRVRLVSSELSHVLKACVDFLSASNWRENVTVLAPTKDVLLELNTNASERQICVRRSVRE